MRRLDVVWRMWAVAARLSEVMEGGRGHFFVAGNSLDIRVESGSLR
jgi:hypothetical protein